VTNPPRSVTAWFRAWEQAMAEHGYPHARLELVITDAGTFGYSWLPDLDAYAEAVLDRAEWSGGDHAWAVAHQCFLAVEGLRPAYVVRSEALRRLMDGMN
jgi:hypothetical protein